MFPKYVCPKMSRTKNDWKFPYSVPRRSLQISMRRAGKPLVPQREPYCSS
jgi:hypothetical protein